MKTELLQRNFLEVRCPNLAFRKSVDDMSNTLLKLLKKMKKDNSATAKALRKLKQVRIFKLSVPIETCQSISVTNSSQITSWFKL